ncbi:methyltransferase domain-containing protein [Clostridium oryzae]|uniref:Putative methyltransferase YcgJ n=1 Tax=Clostridium oryzae TaxID=1450648 RepID=A0A1V4IJ80_9CLOT|nr:methyltransferase domain-containing protein [Clostridium oryzae]OPJ59567.1 putative methyltransferase YcgJ [Clostridium oryzae]
MLKYKEWDTIFENLVHATVSPDKGATFETSKLLSAQVIRFANINKSDTIIDMGSGWGSLSMEIASIANKVISIEPSLENLDAAKHRALDNGISNINFINGSFESPNYSGKADMILSSLVFHQVPFNNRKIAIKNVKKLLKGSGTFIICDTLILFNPLSEPEKFNQVYRYILSKTLPLDIYEKHVKPYFEDNEDYIYTWDDMKKYTPKNNWFYTLNELEKLFNIEGFKIEKVEIETCIPISTPISKTGVKCKKTQQCKVLSITHKGSYKYLNFAYRAIFDYAVENNIIYQKPIFEFYDREPGMIMKGNPKKYITRIYLPIIEL